MLNLSWTEVALSERETRVGYNDPFQPQSAVAQDQDKKRPFRRWLIAAVVVLIIIASIGGFYLHWSSTYPTLYASYVGFISSPCDTLGDRGGSLRINQIVEDRTHGTFTGMIMESYSCSYIGSSCSGSVQDGTVTPSGTVSFTVVPPSYAPISCQYQKFSGAIYSCGEIDGQFSGGGASGSGTFSLDPPGCPTFH